jgi:hypothetical protein
LGGDCPGVIAQGRCPGDTRGCLKSIYKPILKNHALAQSLLSRVFSWDFVFLVVDIFYG